MSDWKTRLFRRVDRLHIRFNEQIKHRWPLLSVWLFHKPRTRWLHYRVERSLLSGESLNVGSRQSIVLFTVNKAASMYVLKVLMRLTKPVGLIPVDYTAYFSTSGTKMYRHFKDPGSLANMFRPNGFFFGALRDFCLIPNAEQYKVVVMLRDPRDVLTSKYFSQAYSHSVINEQVYERRKKVRQQTIDEFTLAHAPGLLVSYQQYVAQYAGKSWALVTTYERMVADHDLWLQEIVNFTGLGGDAALIQAIKDDARKVKATGDKAQHIRVAKSGDHASKLRSETITELDRLFSPLMHWFHPAGRTIDHG